MNVNPFIDLFGAPKFRTILVILCACLSLTLAVTSFFQKSVTFDEYNILPQGFAVLQSKAFHLGTGAPHMAAILPAIPLLLSSAKLPDSKINSAKNVYDLGHHFLEENAKHYQEYYFTGRFVSILFLALTGFLAYGFSRSLYGPYAGMLTAVIVFFSPNLIAHGRLITTDIYFTAMVIGSLWGFDYFLRYPGWKSIFPLGMGLGLASVFKFSGVILFAILPLVLFFLFLIQRFRKHYGNRSFTLDGRIWIGSIGVIVITLAMINQSYLWYGSFASIDAYSFDSGFFQGFQALWPQWLPIPLPHYFLMGLDEQLTHKGWNAYLMGEMRRTGFWYYYLVAFLVKTPPPLILLCFLVLVNNRKIDDREIPIIAVTVLSFLIFSFMGHKNIGLRYLLFIIPIMGIWIGRGGRIDKSFSPKQKLLTSLLIGFGTLWIVISSVSIWPNYLAYFNSLSGGPSKGHQYLLDSNLDWGQDLIALKQHLQNKNIQSLDLAYFGTVDPALYNIQYQLIGEKNPQRYMAISANILWGGMHYYTQKLSEGLRQTWGKSEARNFPESFFRQWIAPFQSLKAENIFGHTIYLFDMEKQNKAVRGAINLALHQYEQAIEIYSKIVHEHPDDPIGFVHLAEAHSGLHQYQKAIIFYTRAIDLKDSGINSYLGRAKAYLQLKQFQKAVQDFKAVLSLDPSMEHQIKTYLNFYLEKNAIVPRASN
ncbi:MAG: glycosyltransferase family 39 protein [SAR324 cluster bacterium]|nr:glycosyltransferase family 39 protein [SAR324 cluster bacterium]